MPLRYACSALLLAAFFAFPARPAFAQPGLPAFTELTGTVNPLGTLALPAVGAPTFADLNGDGTPDFVFSPANVQPFPARGNGDGNVALLFFEGVAGVEATFADADFNPFAELATGNPDERAGLPAFGDLDSDGDLDLVVLGENRLVYFENTGTAVAPAFTRRDGTANPFGSVMPGFLSLADLDSDGDVDVVSVLPGAEGSVALYFENVGGPSAPTFVEADSPFEGVAFSTIVFQLAFSDVDGDGDLDAVAGGLDISNDGTEAVGTLRLLVNTGTPEAPVFEAAPSDPFGSVVFEPNADDVVSVTASDLDGDGDPDFAVFRGGGSFPESIYLENESTGGGVSFALRSGFANPARVINPLEQTLISSAAGDLDGDGDADLVIGTELTVGLVSSPVYIENVGEGTRAEFRLREGAANPFNVFGTNEDETSAPVLGDLDGDGDLDALFVVTDNFMSEGRIAYLENTGTSTAPAFVERTGTANPLGGVAFMLGVGGALADLDGDGDLDFALADAGESGGRLRYFENTGSAAVAVFTLRTGPASPLPSAPSASLYGLALGDLDGDRDVDLLLTEIDPDSPVGAGLVRTFENVGSAQVPAFTERVGADAPFAGRFVLPLQPSIADFDGDGDADVVVGTADVEEVDGGEEVFGNRLRYFVNEGVMPVAVNPGVPVAGGFALAAAYPNPFAADTRLVLTLDREQPVTVAVYDALGRRVAVLHDGPLAAGSEHMFRLDGAALAPGLYLVQVRGAGGTASQKVTKLR